MNIFFYYYEHDINEPIIRRHLEKFKELELQKHYDFSDLATSTI